MRTTHYLLMSITIPCALAVGASACMTFEAEDALLTLDGTIPSGQFGAQVAPVGDFNGDGMADFCRYWL